METFKVTREIVRSDLTKSFGSNNPVALVKATFAALKELRPKADVERLRQVTLT